MRKSSYYYVHQDWPDADIAVMHLDISVTPTAYLKASKGYPIVVNGAAIEGEYNKKYDRSAHIRIELHHAGLS